MRKTSLVLAVLLAVAGICVVLWPVVTGHKLQAEQTPKQCRNCCAGVLRRA